jgi:hypothetical protein
MTFKDLLSTFGLTDPKTIWGWLIFLSTIGIEVIPQIKFKPWSALLRWIGNNLNNKLNNKIDAKVDALDEKLVKKDSELSNKIDEINSKVDGLNKALQKHISESEMKTLQDTRRDILDFCNACMNGRKHTKEQFDFVIDECDKYEKYVEDNGIKNGVIEAAIKEIRRLYDKCIQEHSFLTEIRDEKKQ